MNRLRRGEGGGRKKKWHEKNPPILVAPGVSRFPSPCPVPASSEGSVTHCPGQDVERDIAAGSREQADLASALSAAVSLVRQRLMNPKARDRNQLRHRACSSVRGERGSGPRSLRGSERSSRRRMTLFSDDAIRVKDFLRSRWLAARCGESCFSWASRAVLRNI